MSDSTADPNAVRVAPEPENPFALQGWSDGLTTVGLLIITWLTLLQFPVLPELQLDPSWKMALSYLQQTDLQFGTDIVFTYGPLGYLLASSATGFNTLDHIIWQLTANLLFALTIVAAGRSLQGGKQFIYYVFFLGMAIGYLDVFQMIMILFYALGLLQERVLRYRSVTLALTVMITLLALIKFTNLLFAGFAIGCITLWLCYQRRWSRALLIGVGFGGTFTLGWLWSGQSVLNLPAFIINSLSISQGYVDSMGLAETPWMFACGVTAGLSLVIFLSLHISSQADFPRILTAWAISGAGAFLNWKHGFVRADGHVFAHFIFCLLFMVTYPRLLPIPRIWSRGRHALLLGSMATCSAASIAGIWAQSPVSLLNIGAVINSRLVTNVSSITHLNTLDEQNRASYRAMQATHRLPSIKPLTADGQSVDVMGHDIGYAILNDLNYHPRPTLQSYAALTPRLAQLNEAFMADPARAPDMILSRLQTIDDRVPTLDDSLAWAQLYRNYDYLMEEKGFLFWTRRESQPPPIDRQLISESTVGFGTDISSPIRDNDVIWCELEIRPSFLGRIRQFFYKPPSTWLHSDDGGNDQRVFLIPPILGRAGFPVYPYFTNNQNIIRYQNGHPAPRLMRFSLQVDPAEAKYFQSEIKVRFYAQPAYPRSSKLNEAGDIRRFRMFNRIPDHIKAAVEPALAYENNEDRLLVHAPSELEFDLPGTHHEIRGNYGIFPGAYTGDGDTDGVEFFIEWIKPSGELVVLFERWLNPLAEVEDRGMQSFTVSLPAEPGRLRLRTTNGPVDYIVFDWAYWTNVVFE